MCNCEIFWHFIYLINKKAKRLFTNKINMSKKAILLLGITGRGKSTTGNVLLNQSPDKDKILNAPFAPDSGASGCTQVFNKQESDKHNLVIIDPNFKINMEIDIWCWGITSYEIPRYPPFDIDYGATGCTQVFNRRNSSNQYNHNDNRRNSNNQCKRNNQYKHKSIR